MQFSSHPWYSGRGVKSLGLGLLLALVLLGASTASAKDQLVTYPAPVGAALNQDFSVKVRQPGGKWQNVNGLNQTICLSPPAFEIEGKGDEEIVNSKPLNGTICLSLLLRKILKNNLDL